MNIYTYLMVCTHYNVHQYTYQKNNNNNVHQYLHFFYLKFEPQFIR
jgi:hypothetical protein